MGRDTSHLDALRLRLSNERSRRDAATGRERIARTVLVEGIEREVAGELRFLGLSDAEPVEIDKEALFLELMQGESPATVSALMGGQDLKLEGAKA